MNWYGQRSKKKTNSDFESAAFGKKMENLIKHRDIKLVKTERRRDYLVSKPNYYTTKFFT